MRNPEHNVGWCVCQPAGPHMLAREGVAKLGLARSMASLGRGGIATMLSCAIESQRWAGACGAGARLNELCRVAHCSTGNSGMTYNSQSYRIACHSAES